MKERIGEFGIWICLQVCLGAYRVVGRVANKFGGEVRHRFSTTDAVVFQEAILRCAETDGAGFEPILFCCVFVSSGTRGGDRVVGHSKKPKQ